MRRRGGGARPGRHPLSRQPLSVSHATRRRRRTVRVRAPPGVITKSCFISRDLPRGRAAHQQQYVVCLCHGTWRLILMHLPSPAAPPRPGLALRTTARAARHLSRSRHPALAHRAPRPHAHRRAASSHSAAARHDHRAEEQAAWRLRLACLLRLRRLAPLALCSLAAPQGWAYSAAASGKTEAGGGADAAASRAMVSSRAWSRVTSGHLGQSQVASAPLSRALSRSRAGSSSVLPAARGRDQAEIRPRSPKQRQQPRCGRGAAA